MNVTTQALIAPLRWPRILSHMEMANVKNGNIMIMIAVSSRLPASCRGESR